MSDSKVKVAVRVRPMNRREIELNTKCVVDMEENQTVLRPPPSNSKGENRTVEGKRLARIQNCDATDCKNRYEQRMRRQLAINQCSYGLEKKGKVFLRSGNNHEAVTVHMGARP
ncbi:Kinesin-like protein KIF13A [Acipenser ruthenus]|uniref:Kinesin-like protein KIF13A n=1 Tax=Acipenser ruthenus TaxID=7906 RepID=A0A662YYQ2_ACIRT|nr:Kinesin-like protein KIF13A [Acipenser ruthenus]